MRTSESIQEAIGARAARANREVNEVVAELRASTAKDVGGQTGLFLARARRATDVRDAFRARTAR